MRLWLLRHGEAEPYSRNDAARALTERGRKEVRKSAERLVGENIQHVLVSPYLRAQQTAELVREVLGLRQPLNTVEWATPDDPVREAVDALGAYSGDLLLVSHNPLLGQMGGFLINGHLQLPLALHTASLVLLEGEAAIPGLMNLGGLFHPQ